MIDKIRNKVDEWIKRQELGEKPKKFFLGWSKNLVKFVLPIFRTMLLVWLFQKIGGRIGVLEAILVIQTIFLAKSRWFSKD